MNDESYSTYLNNVYSSLLFSFYLCRYWLIYIWFYNFYEFYVGQKKQPTFSYLVSTYSYCWSS